MLLSLGFFLVQALLTFAATPEEWRSHTVYQIMTDRFATEDGSTPDCDLVVGKYCGGKWAGITKKLDYIQDMGFTAIWISPINHNVEVEGDGQAYHGYYQDNLWELNEHFGSREDLLALSKAVHDRGMLFMVDIVVNHFGWAGNGSEAVDYSKFFPFNDSRYFHPPCPITTTAYANMTQVTSCWLGYDTPISLADVDTTREDVRLGYQFWIDTLVTEFGIDGIRIDTVTYVEKDFWPGFQEAAHVYGMGEVFDPDVAFVCDYQNYVDGVLNYPLFYDLQATFKSTDGSIEKLVSKVDTLKGPACKDPTFFGAFSENHDNVRFPSLTQDLALIKNMIAFPMLYDGIPITYYGQEQLYSGGKDPQNREPLWTSGYNTTTPLYAFISTINHIRHKAIKDDADYTVYRAYPIYYDNTTIALRKGRDDNQVVSVFSNKASGGADYSFNLPNTGYPAGSNITEILSCNTLTIIDEGNVPVAMGKGEPKIFYPSAKLAGSGICNF